MKGAVTGLCRIGPSRPSPRGPAPGPALRQGHEQHAAAGSTGVDPALPEGARVRHRHQGPEGARPGRAQCTRALNLRLRPQDHLGAAEERDRARRSPAPSPRHPRPGWCGRRCTGVARQAIAPSRAVPRKLRLQLDGGEAARALRQGGHAAVAAARVGQRDHRGGMQEAVGRDQASLAPPCRLSTDSELTVRFPRRASPGR